MWVWQVQEAKSHFSEVLERARSEGPQTITKHGTETAVVMSVEEYRRLKGPERTLLDVLMGGPKFDDFKLPPREIDPPREFNWDDEDDTTSIEK